MIIADTGFLLALFNANDRLHSNAIQALNRISEPQRGLGRTGSGVVLTELPPGDDRTFNEIDAI